MRPIDVSMPLFERMPSFPDDPPFGCRSLRSVDRGDAYDLSLLTLGSHAGTHVDPPRHFFPDGAGVDRLDLDQLNGPCRVIEIPPGVQAIGPDEVARVPAGTERALFRTPNSERWARSLEFFPDFVGVDDAGARALIERGVRLAGIDSLSIESDPAGRFPVHRRLLRGGTVILEGLLLGTAAAGPYELRCLPLAVRDGDGGPARAVLVAPP